MKGTWASAAPLCTFAAQHVARRFASQDAPDFDFFSGLMALLVLAAILLTMVFLRSLLDYWRSHRNLVNDCRIWFSVNTGIADRFRGIKNVDWRAKGNQR